MNIIVRNTFFLSASQIFSRLIGLVYTVILARFLGVESFGIYTFALALLYNFIPVADFGLERFVLRDLSRYPEQSLNYFHRLLPLRFLLALLAHLGLILTGILLGRPGIEVTYIALLGFILLPYNFIYLVVNFQNSKEKMEYMAMANIGVALITAILGLVFVLLKFSLFWVITAYIIGNLTIAVFYWKRINQWGLSFKWIIDKEFCIKAIKQSWSFALLTIISVFYLRVSIIMVNIFQGPYLTGIYGSAFKFIEALILIPQSLALALFPLSSRLFMEDKNRLTRIYLKGLAVLVVLSLPLSLIFVFLPKVIVNFTYGNQYALSASVFPVFGLAIILLFLNSLPGNIILNSSKANYFIPFILFYFILQITIGLILIPKYSIIGAAWMIVISESIAFIFNNIFVWRLLRE